MDAHTGVAIREGCSGGTRPLGAYSFTRNSSKNASKHVILRPKIRKFFGERAQPLPRPLPHQEGTPYPCPTSQVPPLQLDSRYATGCSVFYFCLPSPQMGLGLCSPKLCVLGRKFADWPKLGEGRRQLPFSLCLNDTVLNECCVAWCSRIFTES